MKASRVGWVGWSWSTLMKIHIFFGSAATAGVLWRFFLEGAGWLGQDSWLQVARTSQAIAAHYVTVCSVYIHIIFVCIFTWGLLFPSVSIMPFLGQFGNLEECKAAITWLSYIMPFSFHYPFVPSSSKSTHHAHSPSCAVEIPPPCQSSTERPGSLLCRVAAIWLFIWLLCWGVENLHRWGTLSCWNMWHLRSDTLELLIPRCLYSNVDTGLITPPPPPPPRQKVRRSRRFSIHFELTKPPSIKRVFPW